MDRPGGRRVLPVLAAAALVCLAAAAGWAVYELRTHDILTDFEGPYIRARAVALSIEALAAAWLAAVVLYAGRAARTPRGDRPSARRLARSSVLVACIYAALSILVQPRVVREYETIRRKSAEAANFARTAIEAIEQQDWAAAIASIEGYIAIDPVDATWRLKLDHARARDRESAAAPPPPAVAPAQRTEPGVGDLLAASRRYMAQQDYATAYAFALRAAAVSPANGEAAELRAAAAQALARLEPDAAAWAASALYGIKERATAALGRGDPVAAYYILKRGAEAHAGDRELLELLAAAEAGLARFAFFRDTAPESHKVPQRDRVQDVAFVNRREPGLVEVVYAGSVARVPRTITEVRTRETDGTLYSSRRQIVEVTLYDIEVIAFGAGGAVYHLRAPLGRLLPASVGPAAPKRALDHLTPPASTDVALAQVALLALDRRVETGRLGPVLVAGSERRFASFGAVAGAASVLPLTVPPETLWTARLDPGSVRERSIVELWTLLRARPAIDVRVELVLRAVRPFVLLILSALAAALAGSRAVAAPPSIGSYALAPAVAAAGHMAFELALHGTRIAAVSLAGLGWTAGLIALAAALAGLLVLSFIGMDRTLRRQR